ncbi:MAG: hypothetical protein R6U31_05985 [bacterium]
MRYYALIVLSVVLLITGCTLSDRSPANISDWFPAFNEGDTVSYYVSDSMFVHWETDTLTLENSDKDTYSAYEEIVSVNESSSMITVKINYWDNNDSLSGYYYICDKVNHRICLSYDSVPGTGDVVLLTVPVDSGTGWSSDGYSGESYSFSITQNPSKKRVYNNDYYNVLPVESNELLHGKLYEIFWWSYEHGLVRRVITSRTVDDIGTCGYVERVRTLKYSRSSRD